MLREWKHRPGALINRAARLISRDADSRFKALAISGGQIPIFAALQDGAALTQTALAKLIKIEQPTMAATLTRMERDGWIERQPDRADGRSSLIRLTPTAAAKIPHLLALLDRGQEEMLAGLDAAERQVLMGLLQRVITNLEAATPGDDGLPASTPLKG